MLAFWGVPQRIVDPKVPWIVFRILFFATANITFCGLDGTCKSPNVGITTAHLAVAIVLHEVAFHFRFLSSLVTSGAGGSVGSQSAIVEIALTSVFTS